MGEIDDLKKRIKELEEENIRLRSSAPLLAEIKMDTSELEKYLTFMNQAYPVAIRECNNYKKAFNFACMVLASKGCKGCVVENKCNGEGVCTTHIREYFLKEAGEKNE